MYYFDNKFLMHYLNLETELKVYVNSEYYTIADAYDIADPQTGYGYTVYGEPRKFDYRAIDHIMVNGKTFNIDQLQQAYGEKPESGEGEEKSAEKEGEPKKPEEPKKEPAKESIQLHSYVQNIDIGHPKFLTKGSVIALGEGWVTYEYFSSETGKMSTTTVKSKSVKVI